jgi:hypothetical protein
MGEESNEGCESIKSHDYGLLRDEGEEEESGRLSIKYLGKNNKEV